MTLEAFGTAFVTELTHVGPDTRARYLDQLTTLAAQRRPVRRLVRDVRYVKVTDRAKSR